MGRESRVSLAAGMLSRQRTCVEEACKILQTLFGEHGPLVIKSDQGSAYVAEETRQLLRQWQDQPLFSPKRLSQYNGALER